MGWFFGCTLPLMGNDAGARLAFRVTPGEGNAQVPGERRASGLWGQRFGERGSISRGRHQALWAHGLALIPLVRRTRKPRRMRLWDRRRLRKRCLSDPMNDQLKPSSPIEPARHRSRTGCRGHVVGGLIASTFQPQKPSLGLGRRASGLPMVA